MEHKHEHHLAIGYDYPNLPVIAYYYGISSVQTCAVDEWIPQRRKLVWSNH